ncbi:MAG TPA: ABC transporter ATP-binding protein [Anaerolineales bacterium]|nr:ABC transporter ATP-binding protein [Anaerolineales bacterium]
MSFIVEIRELVKQYPGALEPSVNGISFGILKGEVFSLLGPNGAGKTTTISMLSCLLEPTAGDAEIAGHSVRGDPLAVKRAIGVVPQDIALYPTLSARENLTFWGQMYGMGGGELRKRVDEVLETVGLRDRAKDRIEAYSGGMKRRINIAVGLLHRPQVVFMDEPTVGIDPQSRRNILDTVKALNAQGMTVLYTTHYMEEAEELSHRIGIIDHGKLIALGTQEELTQLVGHEDVVELRIAAEHSSPDLLKAFSAVTGVKQATADDGTVRLIAQDGNAALPELITTANARGVKVAGVNIQEPNLEAVFLRLTGRALRD